MNIPNKLTISRLFLTIIFMLFLFSKGALAKSLALVSFLVASLTDFLDGFIAKRNNQITDFGILMDPIADKILVLSAFLAFVEMQLIPAWMAVIIIFRELAVTGVRILALAKGRVLQSDDGGKHKTVCQISAIFLILLSLIFKEAGQKTFEFWTSQTERIYKDGVFGIMLVTVILTLTSGIMYIVKNREVYSNAKAD